MSAPSPATAAFRVHFDDGVAVQVTATDTADARTQAKELRPGLLKPLRIVKVKRVRS